MSLKLQFWLSLFLSLLAFSAMRIYGGELMHVMLHMQYAFSYTDFSELVASLSQADKEKLTYIFALDYIFPPAYSMLIFTIIRMLSRSKKALFMGILAFVAAFFDYIENTFHLYFMHTTNGLTPFPYLLSEIICTLKWVLILITVFYAIALLFSYQASRMRSGK